MFNCSLSRQMHRESSQNINTRQFSTENPNKKFSGGAEEKLEACILILEIVVSIGISFISEHNYLFQKSSKMARQVG